MRGVGRGEGLIVPALTLDIYNFFFLLATTCIALPFDETIDSNLVFSGVRVNLFPTLTRCFLLDWNYGEIVSVSHNDNDALSRLIKGLKQGSQGSFTKQFSMRSYQGLLRREMKKIVNTQRRISFFLWHNVPTNLAYGLSGTLDKLQIWKNCLFVCCLLGHCLLTWQRKTIQFWWRSRS